MQFAEKAAQKKTPLPETGNGVFENHLSAAMQRQTYSLASRT